MADSIGAQTQNLQEGYSIETLFDEYKQDVFRYAMSMLHDHHAAEDVTQEVFLSAFRFIDQYRGEAAVQTWIFAIAKNAVAGYWRKNRIEEPYITEQLPDPSSVIERDTDIYELLGMLDRPSRSVVAMHLGGKLRHKEIAAIMGETETAVKKRYSRAIQWLRQHMKEEG